ncbi:MAG: hypothetical protein ACTSWY_09075 [Promethearchaeota archaeon]
MSIRFQKFIGRIGRRSEFLPFKNLLLNSMEKEAKSKYKKYPGLISKMRKIWENDGYKKENDIAHLIADNNIEFFTEYLNVLFPFRKRDIKFKYISTPSRLDLVITIQYHYSKEEVDYINEVLNSTDFPKNPTAEKICKFLLLYCINSFAIPIEEVFERPFAFMPQQVIAELQKDKSIIISVSAQGREQ